MKIGFRIDIQSDLTPEQLDTAKKFSDDFIIRTLQHPKKLYGGRQSHGGRDTPYSRGSCMSLANDILFLRINRHKRIFGAVTENSLTGDYGNYRFKKETPMVTYAQVGEIKG
jgi:hypothetical protein